MNFFEKRVDVPSNDVTYMLCCTCLRLFATIAATEVVSAGWHLSVDEGPHQKFALRVADEVSGSGEPDKDIHLLAQVLGPCAFLLQQVGVIHSLLIEVCT